MVAYQEFVSLVFEVARERGRTVDSLEASQEVLGIAANLWSENKTKLKGASAEKTKAWIEQNA